MLRKDTLVFGSLAVLIACAASWLAVAQADNNWKCEFRAPIVCGPHWTSTDCPPSVPCVNPDENEPDHYYCYPYAPSSQPCNGFTCIGNCGSIFGDPCETYHEFHCN